MEGRRTDTGIRLDGSSVRQRFYDASGVGRLDRNGGLILTWVEALHLLERGDIDTVDGLAFADLLGRPPDEHALDRWLVYRDLRSRGFYVSMAYRPTAPPPVGSPTFNVRPRGEAPTSDAVAYRVVVVPEAEPVSLASLDDVTIAVADDEGEITYIGVEPADPTGSTAVASWDPPTGYRSGRRVVVPEPSAHMVDPSFFGSRLDDGPLLLNSLEARYLKETDRLNATVPPVNGPVDRRRTRVYSELRERGCVPRSGLKFGADFRVYTDVTDATDPGHSTLLVEVLPADATVSGRELSRAVRLAGGVRKRHVVALVDEEITWLAIERRRP